MVMETKHIFQTTDYQGIVIILSADTWQKKAGNSVPGSHPEIKPYLNDIQNTIESPDFVFQSNRDKRSHIFYALQVGRGMFQGKHLAVIVKYVDEDMGKRGYVSTIYLSRKIYSKGALLWKKKTQLPP